MDRGRGEGDALGIQVAILHPVSSGGPHIGTDGTFSAADRKHMLKQIVFPAGWQPTGKTHIPGRKNWERDEAEELFCYN